MKAYVLHGPKDMRYEERPVGLVGASDALIRVRRTGICGSDVHYYSHGQIGDFVPREPFALGHEFAGEIAEIGSDVKGFSILNYRAANVVFVAAVDIISVLI